MANIKVMLKEVLHDGASVTFKAPCNCSDVTGLVVYYPAIVDNEYVTEHKSFTFKDAHLNDLSSVGNLFAKDAYVKATLDTVNGYAYIQNADTNAYLEGVFADLRSLIGGKAASSHNHNASDINAGTLAVARGGTGVTSNPSMLTNLATTSAASVFAASPRPGVTGTLPVANGGTGATTFASGAALIGAGTGAVTTRAITNNTSSAATSGTNIPTCNTVHYHTAARLNRADTLTAANTSYSTYMARAIAAGTSDLTAGSSSLTSGCIYIVYE